jgi:hypothetical protein
MLPSPLLVDMREFYIVCGASGFDLLRKNPCMFSGREKICVLEGANNGKEVRLPRRVYSVVVMGVLCDHSGHLPCISTSA